MICAWRLIALGVGLLCWLGASSFAQEIGAAPAGFIHDDSRVFDAESYVRLAEEMRDFKQAAGIPIYLETLTFIDGGVTAEKRCKQLVAAWLPQLSGVVICYNRAEGHLPAMQYSAALQEQYSAMELGKISERFESAMKGGSDTRERLLAGIRGVMTEFSQLHHGRGQDGRMFYREDYVLAVAFAGALCLGGLVVGLLVRRRRSSEQGEEQQLYLPEAEVGQRFGAACGGGVMAEISLQS